MERINEHHFFLSGISHKTAPVEIREKISFDSDSCGTTACSLQQQIPGVRECVVLSTCNRTEFYAVTDRPAEEMQASFERFILDASSNTPDILDHFYYMHGSSVIEHLFRVASGIDSMIVGEPQIFGQVKNAYSLACDYKCTGPALNRLFHHAFRVGKQIRNATTIGEGAVSVSYAAVELARKLYGDLTGHSVLLVGAGKTGELCARKLIDSGVDHLYIANRTQDRAQTLAMELTGEVVPFEQMHETIADVEIVITSVTAREPIITHDSLSSLGRVGNGRPLFLIDLGVPRNIDPRVAELDNIILYNIDDLTEVTNSNLDRRKQEIDTAEEIIRIEAAEFLTWLSEREIIPVIKDLKTKCENIRLAELEKMKHRVTPETYEVLDRVTLRIVRKLLHNPIIAMRSSVNGDTREQLLDSVRQLFKDIGES